RDKPLAQDFQRRRQDKHTHRVGDNLADACCALDIDFKNDVLTTRNIADNLMTTGAVEMAVNVCPLEEIVAFGHLGEFVAVNKEIFAAVNFTFTWLARSKGNGVAQVRQLTQNALDESPFSAA